MKKEGALLCWQCLFLCFMANYLADCKKSATFAAEKRLSRKLTDYINR